MIVECVPNFSEGRDPVIVASIAQAVSAVPGAAATATAAARAGSAERPRPTFERVSVARISIGAHALPRLAMGGVAMTPTAMLAQLDPLGIVALALVRLVVASLALGAGERHRNSYVGCHGLGGSLEARGGRPRTAAGK